MPVVAAVAAIIVIAAAISVGQQLGREAAPVMAVTIPAVLALVIYAALWFWHRRRMRELEHGRYDLKHDQIGWRRITLKAHERWYICSDCGMPCPDLKSSEAHSGWHADLLEVLEPDQAAPDEDDIPWSAVTEESTATDPAVPVVPDEQQPVPTPARPDVDSIGEYERKALEFRASMRRLIKTGGRRDGSGDPDA